MENGDVGIATGVAGGKVLVFCLGGETYGIDILSVKEIRGWSAVTRIPKSLPHVLGVLNLRGAIVPIIDLRLRFALDSAEFLSTTVIIVLSLHTEAGHRECGIVVDSVSDVVDVPEESVKPPPALNTSRDGAFLSGLATVDERMLILLNVEELVLSDLQPTGDVRAA